MEKRFYVIVYRGEVYDSGGKSIFGHGETKGAQQILVDMGGIIFDEDDDTASPQLDEIESDLNAMKAGDVLIKERLPEQGKNEGATVIVVCLG